MFRQSLTAAQLGLAFAFAACGAPKSEPATFRYEVLGHANASGNCRLDVRLDRKLSEDEIRVLAGELRATQPQRCSRLLIAYYLPEMVVGGGAWATSRYDPELQIAILGLTQADESKLLRNASGENIVGQWLDDIPGAPSLITIRELGNGLILEQAFRDGSTLKTELVDRAEHGSGKYSPSKPNAFGEFFVVTPRGDLELHDRDGLIRTARQASSKKP